MTKLRPGYVRRLEDEEETYYDLPDNSSFSLVIYLRGGGEVHLRMQKGPAIELGESWATYVKDKHAGKSVPFGFVGGLGWGILTDEVIAVNIYPAPAFKPSLWQRLFG